MPLSPEEIQEVSQGLAEGKAIKEIAPLNGLENVVIRTSDQEETFKTNLTQEVIDSKIGPEISKIASGIEKDIFDITGVEKISNDEKYYDYTKRVVSDFKRKVEAHDSELDELKKNIGGGQGAKVLQEQLDSLSVSHTKALGQKDVEISGLQEKLINGTRDRLISGDYASIKDTFNKELVDSVMFKSHEKMVLNELKSRSKLNEDGTGMVIMNPDGTIKKHETTHAPITMQQELKILFQDMIVQGGAGSGGAGGGGTQAPAQPQGTPTALGIIKNADNTLNVDGVTLPPTVITRPLLDDYLAKDLKLSRQSPEFLAIYSKFAGALPRQ